MSSNRKRIVIETPRPQRHELRRDARPRPRESVVAVTVIVAATLATFLALFITSRPYDPMSSTIEPQQNVPPGQVTMQPSPKPSTTTTPTPQMPVSGMTATANETPKVIVVDDATIQADVEKLLASDPVLAKLDVNTLVENGKVTLVGWVKSAELKQRVEKAIRLVKGVLAVDNQLVVAETTPQQDI